MSMSKNPSILIVDDEPYMAEIIRDELFTENLFSEDEIFISNDGASAVETFKRILPDMVITDLTMPNMDGLQVISAIRAINSESQILVMSGFATLEIATQLFPYNISELIQKPFNISHVIQLIAKVRAQVLVKKQNELLTQRLNDSEKRKSVGLLATGIAAHEINNPNAFLKGNLEIILKYSEKYENLLPVELDRERALEAMKEIAISARAAIQGSDRISQFTRALLNSSKNYGSTYTPTQIKPVLEDALTLTQYRTKKYRIELSTPPSLRAIKGNSSELSQVFINLITNAVDAMEEKHMDSDKGILKIIASDIEGMQMQSIQIIDNGTGIPEDFIKKIFDPFFSTKKSKAGTGLGLSICKGIIDEHGGSLSAQNTPEGGTAFTVTLRWHS